jgi:hypothetical protein
VLDYTGDLDSQVRMVCPDGVDVVLHFAGDGQTLAGALTEKGRLASTMWASASGVSAAHRTFLTLLCGGPVLSWWFH